MTKLIFLILVFSVTIKILRADEGMWIPILLEKYNYEDMKKKGFKLTPEDIYSINKASMKDAVVIFGRGCTGELISDQGLIITNHHCGYPQIQNHSTVEHDYLTDGFWAMGQNEELKNPGLTVQFLIRMEDVTARVLEGVNDETDRSNTVKKNIARIIKEVSNGTKYQVSIKPFYYGNEYYLFIYEEFRDVRLVGAPPSGIGKFGGDTDNWAWPRHTGDFSLFRIYADKNNEPADYSPDNVPYKPKKFFPVSIKGPKKGDFTMVFGYPGRTSEYLTSYGVELISQVENPHMISIRRKILDIMGEDMESSRKIRIQYSSKYAGIANYWKKWMGENKGLRKLNAIAKKKELEKIFETWANSTEENKKKYGFLLSEFEKTYQEYKPYRLAADYINEAFFGIDISELVKTADNYIFSAPDSTMKKGTEAVIKYQADFYKDYNLATDKKLFIAMLKMYSENAGAGFQPEIFKIIDKKFKGDITKYAEYAFKKSIFTDQKKFAGFISAYNPSKKKKISKDPVYQLFSSFMETYGKIYFNISVHGTKIDQLQRQYMAALREMQKDKLFYPDANFTLRVTYGKVDDYDPKDGVHYDYFTTLDGIIQKDDTTIYDYCVPKKLKELYKKKDYGRYGENGIMKVAFTASNHTTGGNSGSPVLNASGELIGVNFDRNWEGTMSDIMYDPDQCRNIAIDIRYALFIIDKFAGAGHLIKEMKIVE